MQRIWSAVPPAAAPVSTRTTARRALYAHELSHWLLFCTQGSSDHDHTKPEIWATDGFVKSFTPDVEPSCPAPDGVTSQPAAAGNDVIE